VKAYLADHSATCGVTLQEIDPPTPGAGVAVVAVAASSLNRGEVQHVMRHHFIPHGERVGWDFSGVVVAAATDGSGPAVGEAVFGWCMARGAWGEQVAVPVTELSVAPPGLSLLDASTLGVAALTAHAALGRIRRRPAGAKVLVTGATGGVGLFALQLAAVAGAAVTASVRRETDASYVRGLAGEAIGVEVGIDPKGEPADLVIDSLGGASLANAMHRVAPGGAIVSLGRTEPGDCAVPPNWFLKGSRLDGLNVYSAFRRGAVAEALSEMGALVAAGRLRTGVELVRPAGDLPQAMEMLIDRKVRGKAVITWEGG
jgi:NADPH:quinone reductase-like Zn-dependent oxidoreductase